MALDPIWCTHLETTGPVDGSRICIRCGQAVPEPNIRGDLRLAIEIVARDHGPYGHHSLRCMKIDGEWCCADDCQMR